MPLLFKKNFVHDTHKKHLAIHVGQQHICELCLKTFSLKSNFNAHFKICQTKTPEQRKKSKKKIVVVQKCLGRQLLLIPARCCQTNQR